MNERIIPQPVNMDEKYPMSGAISKQERLDQDLARVRPVSEPRIPDSVYADTQATPVAVPKSVKVETPIHQSLPEAPSFADPELVHKVEAQDDILVDGHMLGTEQGSIGEMLETLIDTAKKTNAAYDHIASSVDSLQPNETEDRNLKVAETIAENVESSRATLDHAPDVVTKAASSIEETAKPEESSSVSEVEFDEPGQDMLSAESNVKPPAELTGDVPDVAEGNFVQGLTNEQVVHPATTDDEYIPGAKKMNAFELQEIQDFSTTHYRIIDGVNPELAKLRAPVNPSNIKIIEFKDKPDFDMQKMRIDRATADGERRVQIVAIQSGYSCMVKPMKSREIRTFGRELRDSDTYSYRMSIYAALYSKLCEFSCGPLTFEQWLNATAYPDVQTLIFGLYHATFPVANNYNLTCFNPKCEQVFNVTIGNDTLVCIPPGSVSQQKIMEILNKSADPRELLQASCRHKGIDIFVSKGVKFFRVKTPSIAEFLEHAYRNKKQEVIDANSVDMYYAGYVRGVGTLDIEKYNTSGVQEYYYDNRIETIDREIAMLDPDEKEAFEKAIMSYINKYSVSYQIPRVRCPHCSKIMNQREINMETLFFVVRAQKGLA